MTPACTREVEMTIMMEKYPSQFLFYWKGQKTKNQDPEAIYMVLGRLVANRGAFCAFRDMILRGRGNRIFESKSWVMCGRLAPCFSPAALVTGSRSTWRGNCYFPVSEIMVRRSWCELAAREWNGRQEVVCGLCSCPGMRHSFFEKGDKKLKFSVHTVWQYTD